MFSVSVVHLLVILLVCVAGLLKLPKNRHQPTIKVSLVGSAPKPAEVKPVAPAPDQKAAEPKAVEPRRVESPPPEPVRKKEVKKPAVVPVTAPNRKKISPTEKKRSDWQPRSPEEIRKSSTIAQRTVRRVPQIDPDSVARRITQKVNRINVQSTRTSSAASVTGAEVQRYYDAVGTILHSQWDQPSRAEAGGNPSVAVKITVQADGKVSSARISRASSNAPMNRSVALVLNKLDRLPPFRNYGISGANLVIDVTFELD